MTESNAPIAAVKNLLGRLSPKALLFPLFGILAFMLLWQVGASKVDTSLGKFPGPVVVLEQWNSLVADHQRERSKETSFYERQEKRIADRQAKDPSYVAKIREYTGKPTFFRSNFYQSIYRLGRLWLGNINCHSSGYFNWLKFLYLQCAEPGNPSL